MSSSIDFVNDIIYNPIVSGIISTSIISAFVFILRLINKSHELKHRYLIGSYYGYYFARDERLLVKMDIVIAQKFFRKLTITTRENNAAGYTYEGQVDVLSDVAFSTMKGVNSNDVVFVVIRIPFNKTKELPAASGMITGVSQAAEPSTAKLIISRTPLAEQSVIYDLGNKPWGIVVENWPKAVHELKATAECKLG